MFEHAVYLQNDYNPTLTTEMVIKLPNLKTVALYGDSLEHSVSCAVSLFASSESVDVVSIKNKQPPNTIEGMDDTGSCPYWDLGTEFVLENVASDPADIIEFHIFADDQPQEEQEPALLEIQLHTYFKLLSMAIEDGVSLEEKVVEILKEYAEKHKDELPED